MYAWEVAGAISEAEQTEEDEESGPCTYPLPTTDHQLGRGQKERLSVAREVSTAFKCSTWCSSQHAGYVLRTFKTLALCFCSTVLSFPFFWRHLFFLNPISLSTLNNFNPTLWSSWVYKFQLNKFSYYSLLLNLSFSSILHVCILQYIDLITNSCLSTRYFRNFCAVKARRLTFFFYTPVSKALF